MEDYDYYVFRATSTATRLERAETDEWGQTFPVGSLVIKGNYFCLKDEGGGGVCHKNKGCTHMRVTLRPLFGHQQSSFMGSL